MINKMSLQESILNAVNTIVEQRTNELKVDKTIVAVVEKNMGTFNKKTLYKVMYEGGFFEAVVLNSEEVYLPNTSVYVLIPQGDFSKEKVIIGRANNINFNRDFSATTTMINQYCLIGGNLLYNNKINISDLQYGVYSYHNPQEETDLNNILHRYNQICYYDTDDGYITSLIKNNEESQNLLAFNEQNLKILKDDQTTKLILKADFKTNLTQEQQQCSGGEYGLILDFVFDNLNKKYGSTNGEIFENISKDIIGEAYISKAQAKNFNGELLKDKSLDDIDDETYDYYKIILRDIHEYYINQIRNNNENIKSCIRLLIEYTNNLKTTFSTNNSTKSLYTTDINDILTAYLKLLNELELCENIDDFNTIYNLWWNTAIDGSEKKVVSYKFSSNNMIGNPLSFSQWNTQYQILDLDVENLIRINNITLYKQGFIENSENESKWPINLPGPDIFVKNIQLYLAKPVNSENGDYTLKVQSKNLDNTNASILNSISENDTVIFEAIFMRKLLENLSKGNRISYNWFKEDFSVVSTDSIGYDSLAGTGWKRIDSAIGYTFITNGVENLSYKNNYKCIAQYLENDNNVLILDTNFSVYNKSAEINILLESDLGTAFSFDAGIPEITCKINEDSDNSNNVEDYEEKNSIDYKYYWTITDIANSNKIFLNEDLDNNNFLTYDTAKGVIDNIKYYKLNDNLEKILITNPNEASRISFPVNKLGANFIVECFVKKNNNDGLDEDNFVDVGSATLEFVNKGLDIDLNGFKIRIENGNQIFQYDEYGNAPNSIKQKDPLDILPLQAKIFAPSGVEIQNSNYFVEWIFPTEETMIIPKEILELNSTTQIPQLYRGKTCNFDINDLYNPDYWNNQITCHVRYSNQDLYKDTEFLFTKVGENGTNGTDVTAKIFYKGNDVLNTLHNEPLTLYIQEAIDDNNNSKAMFNVPDGNNKINFLNEELWITEEDKGILDIALYQKGQLVSSDNYSAGYPRWTFLGNSSYSKSYGKYFSIDKVEKIELNKSLYNIKWDNSNDDSKNYLYQIIKAEVQLNTGQMYYATYNLPIIWYNKQTNITTIDHKIAIDRGNYLSSILYNADGRNPIYNHNQGLKIINIPENVSKIVWTAKGGKLTDNSSNSCFKFVDENDNIVTTLIKESDIKSEEMIYVLPNDIYDGGITNNYIEVEFYEENDILFAIAYVPIYMSLNTFGLASLNAWDGNHVTVNEDEGYIMSPQIGAGEKDENNRFTGILMGMTEGEVGHTGQTDSQTGLFGYVKGIQSIFLDAKTGNASFGLPNGLHLNENGELETTNNFEEGRIELRPGGESIVGGWTLGNRSLYYTNKKNNDNEWVRSGKLVKRTEHDYVPNIETGLIEEDREDTYFRYHEKDINYDESGILLYAGKDPYISIKGRPFEKDDIPEEKVPEANTEINNNNNNETQKKSFIKEGDSIELQLDPATPTLFTIFRHNGGKREGIEGEYYSKEEKYPVGSRTFLAGINSQGEFIANGLRNANATDLNVDDKVWKAGSLVTKFAVNTLSAFEDFTYTPAKTNHVGFEITANKENTLAHFFTHLNGLQVIQGQEKSSNYDPTLHISGGFTKNEGEYSRPLALHGKDIQIYAKNNDDSVSNSSDIYASETDANFKISTDEANLQLGSTYLNLFRAGNASNSLLTSGDLKINIGQETPAETFEIEVNIGEENENWQSLNEYDSSFYRYKVFEGNHYYYIKNNSSDIQLKTSGNNRYVHLEHMNIDNSITYQIIKEDNDNYSFIRSDHNSLDTYYRGTYNGKNVYISINSYNNDYIYYLNDKNEVKHITEIYAKENNDYYFLSLEDKDKINLNNLNQYYVLEEVLNSDRYKYIDENSFKNNIYYKNNKIDDIDIIYYKRIDEYGNDIYIQSEYINDNSDSFIRISNEKDLSGNSIIKNYWNKFFSTDLYYKIKYDNTFYYVSSFSFLKNGQSEEKFKAGEEKPYPFLASDMNNNCKIKFNANNITYEISMEEDTLDLNGNSLNVYRKYIENSSNVEYLLQTTVDMASKYYYFKNDNNNNQTRIYKKCPILEDNNQKFYKSVNADNITYNYIWIDDRIEWEYYDEELEIYFSAKDINRDTDKVEINLLSHIKINDNDTKWVNLSKWLNLKNNSDFNKYYYLVDKDNNNQYIKQKDFSNETEYVKTEESEEYIGIDNFNYVCLEDDTTDNLYFFVSKQEFKQVYENKRNDRLIIGKKIYDVGIDEWDEWKNDIRTNKNKNIRERKIKITYSGKAYSIHSGTYQNYIQNNNYTTKIDISNNINILNTRLINLYSANCLDIKLTDNINNNNLFKSQIYLGNKVIASEQYNAESVWGKFIHFDSNKPYGMILTSTQLYLLGKSKGKINLADQIEISTDTTGNGKIYSIVNPQIILRAGSNKSATLILNSSNNNWSKVGTNDRTNYPVFRVTGQQDASAYIGINSEIKNNLYREYFAVSMSQKISGGLNIQGKYPTTTNSGLIVASDGSFKSNLFVENNLEAKKGNITVSKGNIIVSKGNITVSKGDITAEGKITTNTGFHGDGAEVTNTSGGGGSGVSISDISGVGGSGTITLLTVSHSNGRPSFGTTAGTITMPTATQIWTAISKSVDSAISTALKNYATKKDVNEALKGYVKTGTTYSLAHKTQSNIVTNVTKGSDTFTGTATVKGEKGTASVSAKNLVDTVSSSPVSGFYITT